jgi:hypothetical protein
MAAILIYAIYGTKTAESHERQVKRFEAILAESSVFQLCKPDHPCTAVLYFDDETKALAAVSKCVHRYLQALFNSEAIPEELADYAELSPERCLEHMKADEHPSFAWSIAIGGKVYGSQVYLV